MNCYNHACPVRMNHSTNYHNCECVACPNKCTGEFLITSDHTLTDNELNDLLRGNNNQLNK